MSENKVQGNGNSNNNNKNDNLPNISSPKCILLHQMNLNITTQLHSSLSSLQYYELSKFSWQLVRLSISFVKLSRYFRTLLVGGCWVISWVYLCCLGAGYCCMYPVYKTNSYYKILINLRKPSTHIIIPSFQNLLIRIPLPKFLPNILQKCKCTFIPKISPRHTYKQ